MFCSPIYGTAHSQRAAAHRSSAVDSLSSTMRPRFKKNAAMPRRTATRDLRVVSNDLFGTSDVSSVPSHATNADDSRVNAQTAQAVTHFDVRRGHNKRSFTA